MTDAELDAVLVPMRERVKQLHQLLASGTDVADPSAVMRNVLGEEGAYAAKLHQIFSEVHKSKEALKLRAPRPAQRQPGDERGFQALGPMLGTKLEPEQEAAAKEAVAKRQGSQHAVVQSHNELAMAAEEYLRNRILRSG